MNSKSFSRLIIGVIVLFAVVFCIFGAATTVGADEIVVKQNALDGQLQVWTTPGMHWQMFGHITRYKKSAQYWFSALEDEGKKTDDSIKVRFSDGGHGTISGSLRYDLPVDYEHMVKLHSKFGSNDAISHELIRQIVNKSVFMTGPLITSRESYAEKRNELIGFIDDQVLHGVYRTERISTMTKDLVSGQEKTVDTVKPKLGSGPNGIEREEISPLEEFGIRAYNVTINGIEYDPQVEDQIKQQQQASMAVQQAMVDARKAEQKAITVAKEGEAKAAEAKWAQEVEKATAVTAAEKEVAVAKLNLDAAQLNKQRDITEAEGEAQAKKLALNADGALKMKLDAYVDVQKSWAAAIGNQRWTPDVQLGSGGGSSPNELMQILQIQAAKQLAVNPNVTR